MRALVCVGVVFALACAPLEDSPPRLVARQPNVLPVFTPPPGFTRLKFGLVPYLSNESMVQSHAAMSTYLSRVLSVPVELDVGQSYQDVIERVEKGEFDLIEMSPFAYALASKHTRLHCIAQAIADGSTTAAGYLFVRDDSPRRSLAELEGASFGFVDPRSTSGYMYPQLILKEAKVSLGKTEFLGNHEAVLMAVKEGRVEAGATYQGAFSALKRAHGIDPLSFRIVAKSPRAPRDVLCVRGDLPASVVDVLTHALLALSIRDRGGREVLGPLDLNGYAAADERTYDGVRRLAASFEAR